MMSLKGRTIPTLVLIKRSLLVVIFLTLIYAVVPFFSKESFFKNRLPNVSPDETEMRITSQKTKSDYAAFIKSVGSKDIFTPAYADLSASSGDDFAKTVENLILVGILAGPPAKIIVEDKLTQRTFYLREGEGFLDSIEVEAISKDSVTFNFRGKTFELYL